MEARWTMLKHQNSLKDKWKIRTVEVFSLKLGYGNYNSEHQISLQEWEERCSVNIKLMQRPRNLSSGAHVLNFSNEPNHWIWIMKVICLRQESDVSHCKDGRLLMGQKLLSYEVMKWLS
jgi:hypothetical protein